jgi:glycosyltransferase involved in cell wall biosynthesis
MQNRIENNLISVVTVIQNNADLLEPYIKETIEVLDKTFTNYELILLDNGSTDDSVCKVKEIVSNISNIRLVILSRQYHKETALAAALEQSIGDYVVLMDFNSTPPSLIPELIKKKY